MNNEILLGIAEQIYDSTGVKNRDMNKPVRREALAISPRLSKILINLSEAKPHDKLLDPFCGIGGILAEALIKRINVHGIDKDKMASCPRCPGCGDDLCLLAEKITGQFVGISHGG